MNEVVHYQGMELTHELSPELHLQRGKQQRVAFVFSCPGRHEEAAGHPAARGTGRNLEMLLSILSIALGRNDLTREEITITNAWPQVEYLSKTGRSEATAREVTAPENIHRLEQELEDVGDFIVFCGERAKTVSKILKLKNNPRFVYIEHLGLRGLSLIRKDVWGEPIIAAELQAMAAGGSRRKREIQCENTRKRLEVLADLVLKQLR